MTMVGGNRSADDRMEILFCLNFCCNGINFVIALRGASNGLVVVVDGYPVGALKGVSGFPSEATSQTTWEKRY